MKPKYAIESALAMKMKYIHLIQQQSLSSKEVKKELRNNQTHIYFICSRPRFTIEKNSIKISKEKIILTFQKNIEGNISNIEVETENKYKVNDYKLNKPGNHLVLLKNGKEITSVNSSLLYPMLIKNYDHDYNLKILYIGQAFGSDGKRIAPDRIKSHSTLQNIYSDCLSNFPYNEIWLILSSFEPYLISTMGSSTLNHTENFKKSLTNFNQIQTTSIPLDHNCG
jgi:hypothetical protein